MSNKIDNEKITIMEEKFTVCINFLGCDYTWNETMSGMLEEPLGTIVVEAVVDLVSQGCTIVLQPDKIS